ncbi:hypothetical protein [Saccharopolyspora rosea]|uniref:Uncharacterized protein n=1 Tax=Saccharopolyspora rosea TaxID=524884 RepID=A0ABW3G1X4_9PSEU|nr:hypothetical protein [Saccharopolyspora rosea]
MPPLAFDPGLTGARGVELQESYVRDPTTVNILLKLSPDGKDLDQTRIPDIWRVRALASATQDVPAQAVTCAIPDGRRTCNLHNAGVITPSARPVG